MAVRSPCPISGSLDIFGDRWTLLILRDMMFAGRTRFSEFQAAPEGIATNVLSARLAMLEQHGLIAKRPDNEDRRRNRYVLTEKGISLAPILVEMTVWGENNLSGVTVQPGLQDRLATDRAGALEELQDMLRRRAAE